MKSDKMSFRQRKELNLKLSQILEVIDSDHRRDVANRVRDCGTYIEGMFSKTSKNHKITRANFCKHRLCPLCAWRRSRKTYGELIQVVNEISSRGSYRFIFLTLTVKNVKGDDLKSEIEHIFHSWDKLKKRKEFQKAIKGFFRNLEVTYNDKTKEYHPHIHALLCVNNNYFKGRNYIKHSDWQRLWKECCEVDYEPQVDVRVVKDRENKGYERAVAEVGKYTVKAYDYLTHSLEEDVEIVKTLEIALHRKRLTVFGGLLSEVKKELQIKDNEELTDDGDDSIYFDTNDEIVRTVLTWNAGLKMYDIEYK